MPVTSAVVSIQRESVASIWSDLAPLLVQNWRETAAFNEIPANPDQRMYLNAEAAGFLRVYTARLGPDLIGYAAYGVYPSMHYQNERVAKCDVVYVAPEFRHGTDAGLSLFRYAHADLAVDGVSTVYVHSTEARDIGPILRHMGFKEIETVYARRLVEVPHG